MSFFQHFQIVSQTPLSRRQALLGLSLLALSACSRAPKQATASNSSYYTCSMHPFVRSQDPEGRCPVCGMGLILVTNQSGSTSATGSTAEKVIISKQRLEEAGAKTETVQSRPAPGNKEQLLVPSNAVLPTGNTFIVFVDHGSGQIEPREIKLGKQSGDFYEVLSGLKNGEDVFISAIFLLDSESRIQGVLKTWGDRS